MWMYSVADTTEINCFYCLLYPMEWKKKKYILFQQIGDSLWVCLHSHTVRFFLKTISRIKELGLRVKILHYTGYTVSS